MLRAVVRSICIAVVRFFHRQIGVRLLAPLPESGPVLVVANHPNGLIDPILIRIAVGREVGFMAKAPLFENPFGAIAMQAFAALPVYRAKDGNDTSANERTFEAVRERFAADRWVVIFPEGHSHSETTLQRLKTGAARLALSFERARDFRGGLQILPVGLVYEDKERFRSRVAVVAGDPIDVARWQSADTDDEWAAALDLTEQIAGALETVMLQADSEEVWRGFLAVARWTTPDAVADVAKCEARARQLSDRYRQLVVTAPDQADAIAQEARHFVRMLDSLGVDDPFSLHPIRPPSLDRMARNAAVLLLLAPPALVGSLLNIVPYLAIRPLAARVAGDELDIVSSVKALAGVLFYPLTWVIEALFVGAATRPALGVATLLAGPLCGMAAIHFFERVAIRRDAVVGQWLRFTRAHAVESVEAHRQKLALRIEQSLAPEERTS